MKMLMWAALIALTALPLAAASHARPPEAYMLIIPTAGLDLATPAGAAALRSRARAAAAEACGERMAGSRPHSAERCVVDLMEKVERRIRLASGGSSTLAAR